MTGLFAKKSFVGVLIAIIVVIGISIYTISRFSANNHQVPMVSGKASPRAFQTLIHEFYTTTKVHVHIVYFSGMVTHRLLGAETVQILGDNQKVYNVNVNSNGQILKINGSSWPK